MVQEKKSKHLVRIFTHIHDVSVFINRDHPILHPETNKYQKYWEDEERKCIEGMWGDDRKEDLGGWRYCPPQLYYYINYCVIEDEDETSNSVKVINPLCRDIEWVFFYNWLIARGFSGFDGDNVHTSSLIVKKVESGEILSTKERLLMKKLTHIYNDKGELKKYVDPREYLYQTHDKPLGRPLYDNSAKNLFMLTARGTGKSYWKMALISHNFKFHGATRYDDTYFNLKRGPSIVVGAPLSSKSSELLAKFSFNEEFQKSNFGSWGEHEDFIPGYFYQQTLGTLAVNNIKSPYRNAYDYVESGVRRKGGLGTHIIHVTYQDNPTASVGGRPILSVIEEVGLEKNLFKVHGANETTLIRRNKTGSALYGGCVCAGTKVWNNYGELCNIEDLKQEDGILGYDGEKLIGQKINYLKDPQNKPCYRITTEGNNSIECSHDHPLLKSKPRKEKSYKKIQTYVTEFTNAEDLSIGEYLFISDKVEIFGKEEIKNARTYGLLIGDGHYGKDSISLCIDSKNVKKYIRKNHETKLRKQFYTKTKRNIFTDITIRNIKQELLENGMYGQVKFNKRFPDNIHTYNKNSLARFIAGYFDADGNVYYNKKKNTYRVVLTSVVEELLIQMKFQLMKFGIHSSIYKENRNITPSKEYEGQQNYIYRLYISRDEDVSRFKENIPILSESKLAVLNKFKRGNRNFGRPKRVLFKYNPNNEKGKDFFYNRGITEFTGIKFEKITKIEYLGEKPVYNLNCGPTHTYISNGFIHAQTGGDIDKIAEPQAIFLDPKTYDMVEFPDLWEGRMKPICLFISAIYTDNTFRDENGNQDIEAALEEEMLQRKKRSEADSTEALDQYMMARPLVPSEIFLGGSLNIFPISLLRERLIEVDTKDIFKNLSYTGTLEWANADKTKVKFEHDLQKKIKPILSNNLELYKNNLRGGIVFYEGPEIQIPDPTRKKSLYKIVYDPIKDDFGGGSLGSIIVYKGVSEDNWAAGLADDIVAEYIGRYDMVDDMHELAIKLAIFYNAKILVETNIPDFTRYCRRNNNKYYNLLQVTPYEAIKAVVKDPGNKYGVGIDMTSPALQIQGEMLIRQWLLTPWKVKDGIKLLNLHKLKSPMILHQLLDYNRDGNFDHISALKMLMLWISQEKEKPIEQSRVTAKNDLDTFFKQVHVRELNTAYYIY